MRKTIIAVNESMFYSLDVDKGERLLRSIDDYLAECKGKSVTLLIDDGRDSGIVDIEIFNVEDSKIDFSKQGNPEISFKGYGRDFKFYFGGVRSLRSKDIGDFGHLKETNKNDTMTLKTLKSQKVVGNSDIYKALDNAIKEMWDMVRDCEDDLDRYPGAKEFKKSFINEKIHQDIIRKELE